MSVFVLRETLENTQKRLSLCFCGARFVARWCTPLAHLFSPSKKALNKYAPLKIQSRMYARACILRANRFNHRFNARDGADAKTRARVQRSFLNPTP